MKIERIVATPVKTETRPGSIQSAAIQEDDWSKSPDAKNNYFSGGTAQIHTLTKYILRAHCDGAVGLGETYRKVTLEHLHRNAKALLGVPLEQLDTRRLPFPVDREYHGFELCIFDLLGKQIGWPMHRLLGGRCREKVECSYWSGRRTPEEAGQVAFEGKQKGFDCIKFKCNQDDDVAAWCREIEARCGRGMRITLDPNQRWGDYETVRARLRSIEKYNVIVVEDPLDRTKLEDYRRLRGSGPAIVRHVALPYCEHGQRAEHALDALKAEAVDGFNFNGPAAPFLRLAELAELAGLPCWHGSEVDLGILEAGYVHAAACAPSCTWPSDIFGHLVRTDDLLAEPLVFEGKHVRVPDLPGLGVALNEAALEACRCGPDIVLGA